MIEERTAIMKAKEYRDKETDAITLELADQKKKLFELRNQAVTEKLENPGLLKKTRREIARIRTILHQRELAATKAAAK
ncbi:MAG: 50S ribosomal protein L29 [Tepidisphaeraceae bacterium]